MRSAWNPDLESIFHHMPLSHDVIAALAPDQSSLKAANGLTKPQKWPTRASSATEPLVWGECQGSGANPYRTVFDTADHGYKCTCPSRKFPCKHVLALMWMYVDDPAPFQPSDVPDWISDWMGRRRKGGAVPAAVPASSGEAKSLTEAMRAEPETEADPKVEARKKAAAEKRAKETEAALMGAADELEQWMADQLRTGLSGFLEDMTDRCRSIAARLVDGKAQALASLLDELPALAMKMPGEERLELIIREFGKIQILLSAWRQSPQDPELRRRIATSETRDTLFENPDALKVTSIWEVIGEDITTRRDGMVSQATWLMNLAKGPRFAVLLDFFPASLGKRTSAFATGEQFDAELVFYPAKVPLRAVLGERKPIEGAPGAWPAINAEDDPLEPFLKAQDDAPWSGALPLLLPEGRFLQDGKSVWWQSLDERLSLPVRNSLSRSITGLHLHGSVGVWDGLRVTMLCAQTDWGRVQLND